MKQWAKQSWLKYGLGYFVGLSSFFLLKLHILPVLVLSFFVEIVVLYYNFSDKGNIELTTYWSWGSIFIILMEVMWVWTYFDWPPSIFEAMIVGVSIMLGAVSLYMVFFYLFRSFKLTFYLQRQIFYTWLTKMFINVMIPLVREEVVPKLVGYPLVIVSIILCWTSIINEMDKKYGN